MGTDMHVAIEVRRPEYDFKTKTPQPHWKFITQWTVDRCYDLFGAFDVRTMWSNGLSVYPVEEMTWQMQQEKKNFGYGFYDIRPDFLKNKVLGWMPPAKEWEEVEDYDRPMITKDWFFDMLVSKTSYDDTYTDKLYYEIYKLMLKKYGKDNVRLVVYFDS